MNQQQLDEFLDFAQNLANQANALAKKYFRSNLHISNKENKTPVTIADQEIELLLRKLINNTYPSHGIVGEEFAKSNEQAEYCWVLDPIDGTVAFSTGKPTFTTLIALLHHNEPILSVITQAISNEVFYAVKSQKAYLNHQEIVTSKQQNISDARLNATTPYMFKTTEEKNKFQKLSSQVKLTSFGGDAYAFALLAAGHIDLIMEADLQYYDVAALIPIIEAAGGIISDWQGKKLTQKFNGQCLASANYALHQQALKIINNI